MKEDKTGEAREREGEEKIAREEKIYRSWGNLSIDRKEDHRIFS